MKNEAIILLAPFEDCSAHRVARHVSSKLVLSVPIDACFHQPLKELFPKVILYDYWKRILEIGIEGINKEVLDLVKRERPKYVLWVSIGDYYEIKESTFKKIKDMGSIIIGWFFDVDIRFDCYSRWRLPYVDYFVVDDIGSVEKFRKLGAWATQAICTGSAKEIDWSKPMHNKYDISFVGSLRGNREAYIKAIKDRDLPIRLFGLNWGRFVSYEEMLNIFRTSRINLNFSMDFTNAKQVIKARIFEVCLSGGFLLTEYFPGIEEYYVPDKEVVCFQNEKELIEKIVYYLDHEDDRLAIARAGWERAVREYSAVQVMRQIFFEIQEDIFQGSKRDFSLVSMPAQIRKRVAAFYFNWGTAFLLENHKGLWTGVLALSLRYDPIAKETWKYFIVGFFPFSLRSFLFRPGTMSYKILCALDSVPYLGAAKRKVGKLIFRR